MRYEEPKSISKEEAERIFAASDVHETQTALVAMALHEPDFDWIQARCLAFTSHPVWTVRAVAATCLGHLARIHGRLDLEAVMPRLDALLVDPQTTGYAEDALSDVKIFLRPQTAALKLVWREIRSLARALAPSCPSRRCI